MIEQIWTLTNDKNAGCNSEMNSDSNAGHGHSACIGSGVGPGENVLLGFGESPSFQKYLMDRRGDFGYNV